MKIQIDVPKDVHLQLKILKPICGFSNLSETAVFVLSRNIGELVSKEGRTLKREILNEKQNEIEEVDAYESNELDTAKTSNQYKKEQKN